MRISSVTTRPLPAVPFVQAAGSACACEEGEKDSASTVGQIEDSLELSEAAESKDDPEAELSEEEQAQVEELKARDREVRAHEQAHLAAAGPYATGGPSYTYQTGPDGKQYAIGGEVQIDTSAEADPEATLQKARVIRAAAQAPAEPSSQDRAVAAAASQMEVEARRQILEEQQAEQQEQTQEGSSDAPLLGLEGFDSPEQVGNTIDLVA